ncbi:DUF281 domain-containing protein [Caenorhabditis elegans]|uniref:DUF281 domain-containing protein n=1 Tax=Caenorhabditis elegans TaxID=6239 RepID=Q9U5B7_CAEEL|nr:DUF281 domain-containing protein [Caenorhabditis elegans]CCD69618.2 DUF281 domain-containing protein [Caenorhabditis elegans]
MNILTLFLIIPCLIAKTECCMRMVPPDDVYIPSTLAPEESTKSPGEITMAPEESTLAPEDTTLIASEEISSTTSNMETDTTEEMTTPTTMTTEETTTQSAHVCLTRTNCPALSSPVIWSQMMTVEENGCTEFVCPEDFVPRVVSTFSRSSIETPPGFTDFTSFIIQPPEPYDAGINTIDYFGIVCDGSLAVSQYPRGIMPLGGDVIGDDGSLDGLYSVATMITCV